MTGHIRRWALLFVALAMLAVALVACGLPSGYAPPNARSAALMSTPVGASSPTPAFSPFTIGAWPSNSMPAAGKGVTIYIICQIQDPTMARPNQPAAGQPVSVRLLDPVNRTYIGTTGDSGIANVRVAFTHARANAHHRHCDVHLEGRYIPEPDILHTRIISRIVLGRHVATRRDAANAIGDCHASAQSRTYRYTYTRATSAATRADANPNPNTHTRTNGYARATSLDADACAMTRDALTDTRASRIASSG